MGRFGVHSGYLKAQNVQSGSISVTLDANGDGSSSVTFKRKFKNVPIVLTNIQASDDTATSNPSSVTLSGFTMNVDGAQTTGDTVTVGYMAIDDPANGFG